MSRYNRCWQNGVINSSQPYVQGTVDPWADYAIGNPFLRTVVNLPPPERTAVERYADWAVGISKGRPTGECCTPNQYTQGCRTFVGYDEVSCIPLGVEVNPSGKDNPACPVPKRN